jgi:hypothetical protein
MVSVPALVMISALQWILASLLWLLMPFGELAHPYVL